MTILFDRRATVTVDTIQFDALDFAFRVEKSLKPAPNTCELTIWNLNQDHIGQLEELKPKAKQATQGIPCKIDAGYKDATSLIWLGDLRTVETRREGPDWITTLTSGDGEKAWQHARQHISYGPKTPIETVLRAIARELGVGAGNIGKFVHRLKIAGSAIFPAGIVLSGPVQRQLVDFARSADLEVSIQDGALQFLDRGQALAGRSLVLKSGTGLLDSPSVDNEGVLSARIQMIEDIRPGMVVVLDAERIKGNYRIEEAAWIGDTSGSEWSIELTASRY